MPVYSVRDYGAVGDGSTDDTQAIQKAIDACTEAGGGRVLVPGGGTCLCGTIVLKSRVELHLEAGSTLAAQLTKDAFPYTAIPQFEGEAGNPAWIQAFEASDISITGHGVIDGRARLRIQEDLGSIYRCKPFLFLICPVACKRVRIQDVTIKDGDFWTVHPIGCTDVVIHGISILNDLKQPNCDGINPDCCQNVRISDCYIQTGDDCIAVKSERGVQQYGPCEDITVTGCTFVSTSCAIKIGSGTVGPIRNMIFDSCVIRRSNRGLGIQHRDQGTVENITFSNMVVETRLFADCWWGKAEPIYVTSFQRTPGSQLGPVRNIRFCNILCQSEAGAYLAGGTGSSIENVLLDNVRLTINKTTAHPGGEYDRRPCAVDGVVPHDIAGIYAEKIQELCLQHSRVLWGENRAENFGAALETHQVMELNLHEFSGTAAHTDMEATIIDA